MKIFRSLVRLAVVMVAAGGSLVVAAPALAAWSGWTRLRGDDWTYLTDLPNGDPNYGLPGVPRMYQRDNTSTAQAWYFQAVSTPGLDGFYKIGNSSLSGCLVRPATTSGVISVQPCNGGYPTLWKAIPGTRPGTIRLASAVDGSCMTYSEDFGYSAIYPGTCGQVYRTDSQDFEAVA
jgi:hypothetical protein